jgi:hypothetical protein
MFLQKHYNRNYDEDIDLFYRRMFAELARKIHGGLADVVQAVEMT